MDSSGSEKGVVIDFKAAMEAKKSLQEQFESRVARVLGESGVWPEDAYELASGSSREMSRCSAEEVGKRILKRIGWSTEEDLE